MKKSIQFISLVIISFYSSTLLAVNDGGTGGPEPQHLFTSLWHWMSHWWGS